MRDADLAGALGDLRFDVLDASPLGEHEEQRLAVGPAEHRREKILLDRDPLDDLAALADTRRSTRVCGSWVQMQPSASRQMPSGPMSSAHTRRFANPPSASMSNASSRPVNDSDMISVEPSGVITIPFGNAMPSATRRADPSGVTSAAMPGTSGAARRP